MFYLCNCTSICDFTFDNTIIPSLSLHKIQLSLPHLPDNKVKDLPFELTPETGFDEK